MTSRVFLKVQSRVSTLSKGVQPSKGVDPFNSVNLFESVDHFTSVDSQRFPFKGANPFAFQGC